MTKITIDRSVAEQALEALSYYEHRKIEWDYADEQAITALRAALEQPQDINNPVAWISPSALEWITRESEKVVKLTRKAQPEYDFTEPLYLHPQNLNCKSNQKRLAALWGYVKEQPRHPLTDEAIAAIIKSNFVEITNQNLYDAIYLCMRDVESAHDIEAAHGIKEQK